MQIYKNKTEKQYRAAKEYGIYRDFLPCEAGGLRGMSCGRKVVVRHSHAASGDVPPDGGAVSGDVALDGIGEVGHKSTWHFKIKYVNL